jgi:hypothetical protein
MYIETGFPHQLLMSGRQQIFVEVIVAAKTCFVFWKGTITEVFKAVYICTNVKHELGSIY